MAARLSMSSYANMAYTCDSQMVKIKGNENIGVPRLTCQCHEPSQDLTSWWVIRVKCSMVVKSCKSTSELKVFRVVVVRWCITRYESSDALALWSESGT